MRIIILFIFKLEFERLQEQQIVAQLGVGKMVKRGNSFAIVPGSNGMVYLCPDNCETQTSTNKPNSIKANN